MKVGEAEMRGTRKDNGQFGVISSEFGVTSQTRVARRGVKCLNRLEQFKPFKQLEGGAIPLMAAQAQAPEK